MREIKFRAWLEVQNEMYEFDDNESIGDHFNRLIYGFGKYKLMQYTGLKDKNGREIYEGDIISLRNEFAEWKGVAVFDEGAFKLSINRSYGNSLSYFSKTDVFEDMGARTTLNNVYEINGNIYENPELLDTQ